MIRFNCDYSEGAHERILRKLMETNLEQTPGYGEDHYCEEAAPSSGDSVNGKMLTCTSWWAGPRPT